MIESNQNADRPQGGKAAKKSQATVDKINLVCNKVLNLYKVRKAENLFVDVRLSLKLLSSLNKKLTRETVEELHHILRLEDSNLTQKIIDESYDMMCIAVRTILNPQYASLVGFVHQNKAEIERKKNLVEINVWAMGCGVPMDQMTTFHQVCEDRGITISELDSGFEGGLDVNEFMRNFNNQ